MLITTKYNGSISVKRLKQTRGYEHEFTSKIIDLVNSGVEVKLEQAPINTPESWDILIRDIQVPNNQEISDFVIKNGDYNFYYQKIGDNSWMWSDLSVATNFKNIESAFLEKKRLTTTVGGANATIVSKLSNDIQCVVKSSNYYLEKVIPSAVLPKTPTWTWTPSKKDAKIYKYLKDVVKEFEEVLKYNFSLCGIQIHPLILADRLYLVPKIEEKSIGTAKKVSDSIGDNYCIEKQTTLSIRPNNAKVEVLPGAQDLSVNKNQRSYTSQVIKKAFDSYDRLWGRLIFGLIEKYSELSTEENNHVERMFNEHVDALVANGQDYDEAYRIAEPIFINWFKNPKCILKSESNSEGKEVFFSAGLGYLVKNKLFEPTVYDVKVAVAMIKNQFGSPIWDKAKITIVPTYLLPESKDTEVLTSFQGNESKHYYVLRSPLGNHYNKMLNLVDSEAMATVFDNADEANRVMKIFNDDPNHKSKLERVELQKKDYVIKAESEGYVYFYQDDCWHIGEITWGWSEQMIKATAFDYVFQAKDRIAKIKEEFPHITLKMVVIERMKVGETLKKIAEEKKPLPPDPVLAEHKGFPYLPFTTQPVVLDPRIYSESQVKAYGETVKITAPKTYVITNPYGQFYKLCWKGRTANFLTGWYWGRHPTIFGNIDVANQVVKRISNKYPSKYNDNFWEKTKVIESTFVVKDSAAVVYSIDWAKVDIPGNHDMKHVTPNHLVVGRMGEWITYEKETMLKVKKKVACDLCPPLTQDKYVVVMPGGGNLFYREISKSPFRWEWTLLERATVLSEENANKAKSLLSRIGISNYAIYYREPTYDRYVIEYTYGDKNYYWNENCSFSECWVDLSDATIFETKEEVDKIVNLIGYKAVSLKEIK